MLQESRQKPSRSAPIHTRPIFGMKAVGGDHVLTTGMDRFIVLWSVTVGAPPQMKWRLCSLGGHITALRVDANMACIGCGDNSLRVVDLMHREHRQHCWVAWKGLRTAVTSLAPAGRGVWGYGLQDGSFGVLPVNSSEGPGPAEPLCTRSHPAPVTAVCWIQIVDQDEATEIAADAPKAEEQAEGRGSKKGKTKKEDKKGASEDCRTLIPGLGLVSISAGHKIFLTPVKGTTTILQLQSVAGVPASPCAAVIWPLEGKASKKGEEVLIVAATHKAGEATVETNSFQLFQLEGEELRCKGVVPVDGVDGGATSMSLCESSSSEKRSCRLVCGTSKGGISVFKLQWPPSTTVTQAVQADSTPPPLFAEAMVRQCHSKAVVDVQWRPSGSDQEPSQLLSAGQDGHIRIWLKLQSVANPLQNTGSALLSACWDNSAEEPAVLAGGRDQVAFRWLPSDEASPVTTPAAPAKEAKVDVTCVLVGETLLARLYPDLQWLQDQKQQQRQAMPA
eukprot:symbB.v1.2.021101.t1/scaffold1717.1/size104954/4